MIPFLLSLSLYMYRKSLEGCPTVCSYQWLLLGNEMGEEQGIFNVILFEIVVNIILIIMTFLL